MNLLRKKDDLNCLIRLKTVKRFLLTWVKTVWRWIETLSDDILSKNPIPTGFKGVKLLDPYLKEPLQEQDK